MTSENTLSLLRSIQASKKKLEHTRRIRLLQEQRFHTAYLADTPRRQPSQAWTYLEDDAHDNTSLEYNDVAGVDDVTINITPDGDYHDVEQPGTLSGTPDLRRRRRTTLIAGHEQNIDNLTRELQRYRRQTDPMSSEKGRLIRQCLTDRPDKEPYDAASPRSSPRRVIPDDTKQTTYANDPHTAPYQATNTGQEPYNVQRYNRTDDPPTPQNPW